MVSEMRLFVAASSIDGSGVAKIDSASFEKLKLTDGQKVVVKYGTKQKEMVAKCDSIFCESTVRLMVPDMAYLLVQPGTQAMVVKKNASKPGKAEGPPKNKKGKRGKKGQNKAASLDSF